ncbi:MAG: FecR domain-containing protein [Planctomycetota bacterium]
MSDDYLWDRSGQPDPEIEQLERILGPLGYRPKRPAASPPAGSLLRHRWLPILLVAAAILAVISLGLAPLFYGRSGTWEVAALCGTPTVNDAVMRGTGQLAKGQWLVTDASSRAEIAVGAIGRVEVEPNTRVRLVDTRLTEHRMELSRGTMHARIWAPPRLFFVNTPSAEAIDLGCAYTLRVDDAGQTHLLVTYGYVALNLNGRESRVPTGAACETRPGIGPGTPHFEDASEALRAALAKIDFERGATAEVATVLAEARPRDSLTLWHLLTRVARADRGPVYDRLAVLSPPPPGVTRAGILDLDEHMLTAWQQELGI